MASFTGTIRLEGVTFRYVMFQTSIHGVVREVAQDLSLPQITNMSHPPGDPIQKFDTVTLDLIDDRGFNLIELQVDQLTREVIHDGDQFLGLYASSVRIELVPGKHFRFQITRTGGWISSPVWHLRALDPGFNEPVTPS